MLSLAAYLIFGPKPQSARELNVFAAASLKESFQAIAHSFEASHSGIKVRLEFGGSQDLAAQINQGALADVFASASPKNLEQVAYDPSTRRLFALNRLVIVVPINGSTVPSFRDLSRAKNIVLAAPTVPAGGYALKALDSAASRYGAAWRAVIRSHVVSEEQDVRAVLTKVELGEADAGIVYATDAESANGRVRTTPIPESFQPRIEYLMAVMKSSKIAPDAMSFVRATLAPEGQRAIKDRGFRSPLESRHL
jgi:molybdate transport system substrate-binding protein